MCIRDRYWTERLAGLVESGDMSPAIGLAGSLLGSLAAFQTLAAGAGGDGMAPLFVAAGVMMLTTLAGCAGYLLGTGLATKAQAAVIKFGADLDVLANKLVQLFDEDDDDRSSDDTIDF